MKYLILLCSLLLSTASFSQEDCGTDLYHDILMEKDATYRKALLQNEKALEQLINTRQNNTRNNNVTEPIIVPIVFHIIHLGEPLGEGYNIPDESVHNAVNLMNERFAGVYGGVDTEIQFCLAINDPQGNPTSGISRVDGSGIPKYETYGVHYSGSNGASDNLVKDLSKWPVSEYYNVWCVKTIQGAGGYANYPNGNPYDGTVVPIHSLQSTTLTHELGHGLNLRHTFYGDSNGNNCPTNSSCTYQGDRVCDTPPHKRSDCYTSSCTTEGSLENSTHNYMSYCTSNRSRFTQGQKERMHHAFVTTVRADLLNSLGCAMPQQHDVRFTRILHPKGVTCGNTIYPKIVIRNLGFPLTSLTINYTLDDLTSYNQTIALDVPFSAYDTLVLDPISVTIGDHNLSINLSLPNNQPDQDISNNTLSESFTIRSPDSYAPPPFIQNFDNLDNEFPPDWYQQTTTGNQPPIISSDGAWNIHSYQYNEYTYIYTSKYSNVNGPVTYDIYLEPVYLLNSTNTRLYFNEGWSMSLEQFENINEDYRTTLSVAVSTDCQDNFTTVWEKSNEALITTPPGEITYISDIQGQYADLSAFDGELITIRFRLHSNFERINRLYIDDITLLADNQGILSNCPLNLNPDMFFNANGTPATAANNAGSLADEQATAFLPNYSVGGAVESDWLYPFQENTVAYLDLGREHTIHEIHLYDNWGIGNFKVAPGLPADNLPPIIDIITDIFPRDWRGFTDLNLTTRYLTFYKTDVGAKISEIFICAEPDSITVVTCFDGFQNGNETGVDCGGDCPPCTTCSDGIQNGNETGIDCGGDCPPCLRGTCQLVLSPEMFYNWNGSSAADLQFGGSLVDEQNTMGDPINGDGNEVSSSWQYPWFDGVQSYIDLGTTYNISSIHLFDGYGNGVFEVTAGLPEDNNPPFISFDANAWPPQWRDFQNLNVDARYLTFTRVDGATLINEIAICIQQDNLPTCNDGIQNGNETGIDCGGDCPSCTTCFDGIQNGNETGIDCGGNCPPCQTGTCQLDLSPEMFYNWNGTSAADLQFGGSLVDEQDTMGDPINGDGNEVSSSWQYPWFGGVQSYIDLGTTYNISSIHLFDGYGDGVFEVATGLPGDNNPPFISFNANAWPPQWRDFESLNVDARYLTFNRVDGATLINEVAICGQETTNARNAQQQNYKNKLKDKAVKNTQPNKLVVYPNPAVESLNIVTKATEAPALIKVIDVNGTVKIQQYIYNDKTKHTLNINQLPNGMYFIYTEDKNGHPVSYGRFLKTE